MGERPTPLLSIIVPAYNEEDTIEEVLRGLLDVPYGYKAFRGDLIRSLRLVSDDFRFEPEVTAKVLRTPGVRLYEVPIAYYGRTFAEGKKITWRDGVRAVGALVRFRFAPR